MAFNLWLAEEAHARGLGIALKNAPELVPELVEAYDWAVVESCFVQGWCEKMQPFLDQGKAVFAIEYVEEGVGTDDFCETASELGVSVILKEQELGAWVLGCE